MKSKTEELTDWLRDAYAMEKSLEQMLRRTIDDDESPRALRELARTHLSETARHAEDLERCLKMLGADTSALKTGVATVGEFFKDTMASFASDKKIKDILTSYAGEHFEIACYTAIKAAALDIGESRIATICDTILEDEHRTAEHLLALIPRSVDSYLAAH